MIAIFAAPIDMFFEEMYKEKMTNLITFIANFITLPVPLYVYWYTFFLFLFSPLCLAYPFVLLKMIKNKTKPQLEKKVNSQTCPQSY